jgi:hypothetical protein
MVNPKVRNHHLPVLAQIRVASPCQASWTAMTGDDRSRFCAECKTQVFDLSEMSREQAERLVIERNGDLCARYYQRADGTILTADCAVGAHGRGRNRVAAAAGLAVALIGGGAVAGHQLATSGPVPEAPPEMVLESDTMQIKMTEVESQPILEEVKAITDKLEADQMDHVMGRISFVERDETLQKLEVQKQELEKLRIEVK